MQTNTNAIARLIGIAALAVVVSLASAPRAAASEDIYGSIAVRGDASFIMTTDSGASVTVILSEATKVRQSGKKVAAAELVPGLRVKVEGTYSAENQFVASEIDFGKSDKRIAGAIKGGITPTDMRVATNTENIAKHDERLQQHGQKLDEHGQAIDQNGRDIVANDLKMVATTGKLGTRIDSLDDYTVVDKLIVYFKNGQTKIQPEFATQLKDLAAKAKAVHGYKIQVQGYASAVGSRALNETLSKQRADNVTSALVQAGAVPPTNILVPAAMGISEQFAENKTAKGQAENRRVIVTILQNKGLNEK